MVKPVPISNSVYVQSWTYFLVHHTYSSLLLHQSPKLDWGQEEKGMTEDKMVGWHHQLNGHGFGWTLGVGAGQGGLVCCSPWVTKSRTWLIDWTELLDMPKESWEVEGNFPSLTQTTYFKQPCRLYFPPRTAFRGGVRAQVSPECQSLVWHRAELA